MSYYYYIFFILRVLHLLASLSGPFNLTVTMGNSTSSLPDTSLTLQLRKLKMGPIGGTEMSVGKYHSTLREIPRDLRSHLHCDGSLKPGVLKYSK